ncbi:MAG: hypothetical protein A7316_01530 [Candidatus Altiarchaeales archaeon WOR_SM1_86-2]|nr:MAG: hypothetical protein A7316_01530 [Candidatus Altiarchaeales archaeon WOR_SM1_86-2]
MELKELFGEFKNKKILVVGDVSIDEFVYGKIVKISAEAPVPVIGIELRAHILGQAGNVATNISAMSAYPLISGVIGEDDEGKVLMEKLKDITEINGIFADTSRPTTLKTRIMVKNHQMLRIDREENHGISMDLMKKIVGYVNDKDFDGIVVSDYMNGTVTSELLSNLPTEKPIVIGPKINTSLDYNNTILVANEEKVKGVYGINIITETSIRNIGIKVMSHLGCRNFVMTRGKEDVAVFGEDTFDKVNTYGGEALNKVGVVDTFMAALILSLTSNIDIVKSVEIANYVSGIKIKDMSMGIMNLKEVMKND